MSAGFVGHVQPWLRERLKSNPIPETRHLVDFAGEVGYAMADRQCLEDFLSCVERLCEDNDYVFNKEVVTSVYEQHIDIGAFVMGLKKARKERDALGGTES